MAKAVKKIKKRVVQITPDGLAYIQASFNNIIVSLTNKLVKAASVVQRKTPRMQLKLRLQTRLR
jgi:ribosomal protein S11